MTRGKRIVDLALKLDNNDNANNRPMPNITENHKNVEESIVSFLLPIEECESSPSILPGEAFHQIGINTEYSATDMANVDGNNIELLHDEQSGFEIDSDSIEHQGKVKEPSNNDENKPKRKRRRFRIKQYPSYPQNKKKARTWSKI
ncbi:hypothetical protein ILUMI_09268 [Ignelater luminosus]|uniref:Uncharacterized protein n=1 Tax=Ignelater luminosus TaxID=2038154 RepID=A0A8K0D9J4_IGNLU|nr:hypothetical protein ILUMI_09268 [Ignelater luminosus]